MEEAATAAIVVDGRRYVLHRYPALPCRGQAQSVLDEVGRTGSRERNRRRRPAKPQQQCENGEQRREALLSKSGTSYRSGVLPHQTRQ